MVNDKYSFDFVSMVKEQLSGYIKDGITDDLVKAELIEYEKKIRHLIQEQVNKVVLDGVDKFNDMQSLRDEYKVFMHWKNDA